MIKVFIHKYTHRYLVKFSYNGVPETTKMIEDAKKFDTKIKSRLGNLIDFKKYHGEKLKDFIECEIKYEI